VRLLFVTSPGIASQIIRAFEGGLASHVGIVVDGQVIDATFKHDTELWTMDEFLSKHKVVSDVSFSVPNESVAMWYAHKQLGKPYDWTGLLGFLAWRDWSDDDSWYCSELAMAIAQAGGMKIATGRKRIGVRLMHELANSWTD
jgi:uncharacterized protein YycO